MALPRYGRLIRILGLWLACCFFFQVPGAVAGPSKAPKVETFPVDISDANLRSTRGGTSVVYACNAGSEYGPCVDSPSLCTSQGGKFVGYCFFDGRYEGICCSGLDPANATLTTKPPQAHEDTTTAAPSLPPAPTMTTQTLPPAPTMTSDTAPPAPTMTTQTMPPAPTMTTQTQPPPPTMTTQTLPPAPTMTSDTAPPAPTMTTQTMPPAPTMTSDTPPPAPTMTTQTMPPAPTMTTQTQPPPPTMTTQTLPPAPTMTSDTMPPAPTMTTQTMAPPPSMSTETLPPAPTMTTQSQPPPPTLSTQTLPPAPTLTPPPASSPGGVFEDPTTTVAPTPPTAPTMTTQTQPTPPTMTTQTMPPAPTMPTQTQPPAPTMTTGTMPPAPTMTTQTQPPPPEVTTGTMPPAPTMTTQTQPPPPTMTTGTMPPAPTMTTQTQPPPPEVTTGTMPPAPTMTTQTQPPPPTMTTGTMPPAPTMTTQTQPPPPEITTGSMPPAPTMTTQTPPSQPTMTTQTMPPAPTAPTTQTPPPPPELTTQSLPPAPTMTTQTTPTPPPPSSSFGAIFSSPTPPSVPPAPSFPTQTLPPAPTMTTSLPPTTTESLPTSLPSSTQNVLEDTTTTTAATTTTTTRRPFPTFGTFPPINMTTHQPPNNTQGFPNFTMTTQQSNFTQQFPNFTMTTREQNSTHQFPNFTMSTFPMPSTTTTTTVAPSEETTTAATEAPTEATTAAPTDPPPADVPGGGGNCGEVITADIQSLFQNPSYPSLDTEATVNQYVVVPQEGYCALRVEFLESLLAGEGMQGCSTDSVVIINSEDSPTTPVCGLLQGYQWTVRQIDNQPIRIVVTTQSSAYLWSMNITQIQCSTIKPYQEYESPNCGVKNAKPPPAGIEIPPQPEEPKVVSPTKLLKSKRKTLRDVMSAPLAPAKLLQNAVLNRESSIKIVRGNETGVNEWPWQALLMVNGRPLCGASVINEEWVLTAGHCVHLNLRYPLVSVMTVDLGDHDLRTVKETKNIVARISKIVPNVQNEGVRNDVALIKLATKIPFGKTIRPVCLPKPSTPPNTFAGASGITTGWGRTEDSVISPVLREAVLPIISNERCRQQWASVGDGAGSIIESGMICVGGGDVGPCNGDSGGPLVVQDNDKYRLVGLTSFGLLKGCAVPGVPSVYARVTSYADWIALNLAGE